jgi:hypothetical protein
MKKLLTMSLAISALLLVAVSPASAALKYYGGEVQNNPHVYITFWGKNWNQYSFEREQLREMFSNISGSPWQKILTQYYDGSGPISKYLASSSWTDETINAPNSVNDEKLVNEAEYAISQHGWPTPNIDTQYVIFPAPGSVYEPGYQKGCAQHRYSSKLGAVVIYVGWPGDASFAGCQDDPTGLERAWVGASSTASHEYAESVTNPAGLNSGLTIGWTDATNPENEIGNLCYGSPGRTGLVSGSWVQKIWDNQQNKCWFGLYGTTADISVAGYLHGQPGSVTVNGHVNSDVPVNGTVSVEYRKLEGGVYVYKRSEYPTVKNGFYEFQNEPVGPGTWKVKAAFSSQGEYTGSESAESAAFTIKNTPWYSEGFADGYISRDPDISSWAPGRLDIFGVGADGKTLYHKWYSGGAWSGWEPRTTGYSSGVGAVSWGYNRLDVVGKRASDGTVAHEYWTGTSWQKDNLGGYILSDPDISSWGSGRLDVFALGADGKTLFHKWFTEGAGWSAWEERTTGYSSSPSAVSWGYNRIDVVAKRASDGSVSHEYWDGTSWQKDNLGGYVNGAPEITSWGPGRLDVFALGADSKTMYHKWFTTAEGWSEWEALGTGYSSSPGAVSWGYNRLDVVGIRGSDNGIKHEYWAP